MIRLPFLRVVSALWDYSSLKGAWERLCFQLSSLSSLLRLKWERCPTSHPWPTNPQEQSFTFHRGPIDPLAVERAPLQVAGVKKYRSSDMTDFIYAGKCNENTEKNVAGMTEKEA